MRTVLVGNPNVGKSVVFNRLTGVRVVVSNYPGTTIEYMEGTLRVDGLRMSVVDVPGMYSLIVRDRAEQVAFDLITGQRTRLIVNVIDATNLERNLYLTLQLRELGIPMIVDINMVDAAHHQGIEIDELSLATHLALPVTHTVAVSGQGIAELRALISRMIQMDTMDSSNG